jgi:hypothetical protein
MGLDIAGFHVASVQNDDLVIETGKTVLTFGENHRLESGITVAGNGDIKIAEFPFDALFVAAIAGVASLLFGLRILLLAKVVSYLGLHGSLQQFFGQLLQKPGSPDEVFRILVILHQGIEQVVGYVHRFLQWLPVVTDYDIYTKDFTGSSSLQCKWYAVSNH